MVVTGIAVHVPLQLEVGISLAFNGRDQMDVTGMMIHVSEQLKVGICPSSNGLDQMVVTGTNIHLRQLSDVLTTKTCSITLLTEGALPGRLYNYFVCLAISVFTSIAKPQTL